MHHQASEMDRQDVNTPRPDNENETFSDLLFTYELILNTVYIESRDDAT